MKSKSRERMRAAQKGRKHPDDVKEKIGLAHIGMKRTKETCSNISLSKKGVKLGPPSQEHKDKISAAKKEWWAQRKKELENV